MRFVLAVVLVLGLLGLGLYLKLHGYGQWNWLCVALACLVPFVLGGTFRARDKTRLDDD
jgi:hypothetical protein